MSIALPKPEVICTHESDLDGLLSGLLLQRLAQKLFGSKPRLEAYHNHNWRQRSLNEKCAWVSDMTFDPRLDRPNWVIIDHHTTETPAKKAMLIHDLQKSASLLVYELCQQHGLAKPALDRLVHLSNVADLFLENDPDFELANDYASLVKIYQFWNLHELIEGEPERLLDHALLEVMAVKRRIENPIGYNWSKNHVTEISPNVGYVDSVVGNVNLIVHQLLEQNQTPYPVLVTLLRKGNGTMIASFRSRNGTAVKIAEKFQGGGHANAAGASLPRSTQNMQEAILYLKTILSPPPPREGSLNSLENAFAALEREG
jgi:hypothetical protein